MENDDLTMEDGEIQDGFLGEEEMENRRTLAAAHGEGAGMSWVEAVLLGTRQVSAVHRQPKSVAGKDEDEEGGDDDHDDEALHVKFVQACVSAVGIVVRAVTSCLLTCLLLMDELKRRSLSRLTW